MARGSVALTSVLPPPYAIDCYRLSEMAEAALVKYFDIRNIVVFLEYADFYCALATEANDRVGALFLHRSPSPPLACPVVAGCEKLMNAAAHFCLRNIEMLLSSQQLEGLSDNILASISNVRCALRGNVGALFAWRPLFFVYSQHRLFRRTLPRCPSAR